MFLRMPDWWSWRCRSLWRQSGWISKDVSGYVLLSVGSIRSADWCAGFIRMRWRWLPTAGMAVACLVERLRRVRSRFPV